MPIFCKFFAIALIFTALESKTIESLETKPKGIVRDFYIYQFLQNNNPSKDEVLKLYELIEYKNPKIISLIKSKIALKYLPKPLQCKSKNLIDLRKSDDECFNLGFNLNHAINFKDSDTKRLESALDKKRVGILHHKNALNEILKESGEEFSYFYNNLNDKSAVFNAKPANLAHFNNKNFGKTLYHIVVSRKYPKLTNALLGAKIEGVNDWSFYALALNELESGDKKIAKDYFNKAANATTSRVLRDKAIFWQYKISEVLGENGESFLEALSQSTHFNLYSLFATQKRANAPKYELVFEDNEIFKDLAKESSAPFDIKDPFLWQDLSQKIIALNSDDALIKQAKSLYHKDSLPHLVFVLNRYFNFKKSFFIKPYAEFVSAEDASFVYAVAKQESAFIPSVISRSYALGIMQIMPFNVENFANAQGLKNISYESMFNPQIALKSGAYYLNHLKKEFVHPLFISYAYNGGPTFIRNFLKNPQNFSAKNALDPWFSMEFIPFEESRFYGFNVMANLIIYYQMEGKNIDIEAFLKESLRE